MTDIFREVEEDVRREKLEKLWKAYGNYAVAALVLLFAGIAGWQVWERHDAQERAKVSDSFIAAQRITNPQTAASTFADIARTAPKGYAELARLSEAGAMFASGQTGPAIDLYKQIAKDDNGPVGAVARLRAAWATADTASRKDLASTAPAEAAPTTPASGSDSPPVARSDAVSVVNDFISPERPAEDLLHHGPMLTDHSTVPREDAVATRQRAFAVKCLG